MVHTRWCLLPVLLSLLLAAPAAAQVVVLHSFATGPADGGYPNGSLIQSGSSLYGMTEFGGSTNGHGTIFRIGTDGSGFALLHSFTNTTNDGALPYGTPLQSGSTLYGVTRNGGSTDYGTIFQIGTNGTGFSLLHSFTGGSDGGLNQSPGALVQSGSTLFGTTLEVNVTTSYGKIFRMNTDGTGFTLLHTFAGYPNDGAYPYGSLVQSGSFFYSMTQNGGSSNTGGGTVYRIGTDGTGFQVLHSFNGADGGGPLGSPILSGSTLYGMTRLGGTSGDGTIFRIGTDGTGFQVLHSFAGDADGREPYDSLLLSGSTLYGMTSGNNGGPTSLGTLFQIGTDGTGYSVLHSFTGGPDDGAIPYGSLIQSGSMLYGMTSRGGSIDAGTIFSFPVPVPEPSSLVLAAAGAAAFFARRRRVSENASGGTPARL
jgi:uncharacterized repeat protein (TIGR03803 family)